MHLLLKGTLRFERFLTEYLGQNIFEVSSKCVKIRSLADSWKYFEAGMAAQKMLWLRYGVFWKVVGVKRAVEKMLWLRQKRVGNLMVSRWLL